MFVYVCVYIYIVLILLYLYIYIYSIEPSQSLRTAFRKAFRRTFPQSHSQSQHVQQRQRVVRTLRTPSRDALAEGFANCPGAQPLYIDKKQSKIKKPKIN